MGHARGAGRTAGSRNFGQRSALGLVAGVLSGLFAVAGPASAQFVSDPGTVVQTIQTSTWSPASPDPSGITYRPDRGELLTCDAEVEEMTIWAGVNVWTHSSTGVVSSTASTTAFSNEPSGCCADPAGGRLFFADDVKGSLFEVHFGADGAYGTADDTRVQLRGYVAAGCDDLEDVAYNNLDGHLYVSGGSGQEVCEIEPGPNGVFDGAAPHGDDVLSTFSVASFGILDPEGIVYDPFWNTLVLADRGTRELYELTPEGGFLRQIDVNFPSGTKPSGVTIAPSSTNPMLRSYWVTDRRTDNDGDPFENDGRIFEVVAIPLGGNSAPIVDAGSPQTVEWPANSVNLSGFVNDDGHPHPPGLVLTQWSQQSGAGTVSFGSPDHVSSTATFSAPGDYVLQLLADDSEEQSVDTVAITLNQTVALSVSSLGPGSVSLEPPGGTYLAGSSVTATALPNPDSAFTGWSGDLSGPTNPQQLVMSSDKSVTAAFATLFEVSVQSTGPGSVTLDPPGGTYAAGSVVTVTATPEASAGFDGFGGALGGTTSPQQLTVDSDKNVSASFTQLYGVATATVGPGSLSLVPPTAPYASGTTVSVTASPDADAVFLGWSGDLSGAITPESLLVDADKSVTGTFAMLYDVSLEISGPGSVSLDPPGGRYATGSVVTLTATPDVNAVFDGFGGALTGTSSPQQLIVDANKTVIASFLPAHTLSVTTQGQGSVTLDPPGGSYAAGSQVRLSAVPGPNMLFSHWSGDASGSDNPLSLSMDASRSVTAHFVSTGGGGAACGIGPELAALLPALAWLYGRRARALAPRPT